MKWFYKWINSLFEIDYESLAIKEAEYKINQRKLGLINKATELMKKSNECQDKKLREIYKTEALIYKSEFDKMETK